MKVNPRHNKWRGHTLTIIPFIPDMEDTFPELAKKLRLSGYFSNGIEFSDPNTTYHTLEKYIDEETAQIVADTKVVRMSGFNPFLAVDSLDDPCDPKLPHSQDEEGNPKTWGEWASYIAPDMEDGKRYVKAPDIQHDYFNKGGLTTYDKLLAVEGATIVAPAVWRHLYDQWLATQPVVDG